MTVLGLRVLGFACASSLLLVGVGRAAGRVVPAEFRDDRISVVGRADDGQLVRFYTDSGGGYNAIRQSIATRLALQPIGSSTGPYEADASSPTLVAFPLSMVRSGIPLPNVDASLKGGLVVVSDAAAPFSEDGFLGSRWFRNRVWEIDYPNRSLKLVESSELNGDARRVPLGFQQDEHGDRTTNFPRVTIQVDAEPFDLLLDTGATATSSKETSGIFHREVGAQIGTSFITKSTFDRWVSRHPDWRVLTGADAIHGLTFPMIEVPRIWIAGFEVGPVWFTQRPDRAFREYMTSMMDSPVEGAIGGSGLRFFRVTIDYPAATATFELSASVQ